MKREHWCLHLRVHLGTLIVTNEAGFVLFDQSLYLENGIPLGELLSQCDQAQLKWERDLMLIDEGNPNLEP